MTTAVAATDSLRDHTLEIARNHKASWIQLGQALFTVYKDKKFKDWGFMSFEAYCLKELKIKQTTAAKLLKSYYFLEKEEPQLARAAEPDAEKPEQVPDYESVNLLRLAKENRKLTPHDVAEIRTAVVEKAKEPKEVRAQVKRLIEAKEPPKDADEEKQIKRNTVLRRMISVLSSAKKEFERERLVPGYLLKQMDDLMEKLQTQMGS